jgi:hypothetical protein
MQVVEPQTAVVVLVVLAVVAMAAAQAGLEQTVRRIQVAALVVMARSQTQLVVRALSS